MSGKKVGGIKEYLIAGRLYNKTMQDSLFMKIIRGEIPSHKIYEDDQTYAFLDIHPVQPGHVLVIPKKQVEFVWDLSDQDYQAVMATAKKVAQRIKQVLKPMFVGEQVVGVDVPHAHVHIIPFNSTAEFRNVPDMQADPDHDALAEIAKKLAF
jgi:histidine triad (HIT) family protein